MYVLCVATRTFLLLYGLLGFRSSLSVDGFQHCRHSVRPRNVVWVKRLDKTSAEICKGTKDPQLQLYSVPGNETNPRQINLVLTTPADASRVLITFSGTILDVRSGEIPVSLLSCSGQQDTLLIRHHAGNRTTCIHLLLNLQSIPVHIGRAWVTRNGKVRTMQIKINTKDVHHRKRLKRSSPEALTKIQNGNATETPKMTEISECGKTRSCFRYHKTNSGCGHLECSYFLSYTYKHTQEQTEYEFDVELSGQTKGWVAVGFSSDQQMLGDALVCRTTVNKPDVSVRVYQITMRHSHPTPKDGFRSTFVSGVTQNGFMYCRFQFRSGQDQIMEMTNDWFQLYARGPLSLSTVEGDLGKHQETPLMSDYKISLIKSVNKMNVYTSRGSCVISGVALILLNWTFYCLLRFFF